MHFKMFFVTRLNRKRLLTLSSQVAAKPTDDEMETKSEPIKFSTSKASPTKWKVNQSLGSHHQRPWWNALPIAVVFISVLLWCCLREETDIDEKLGEHLLNKLPGLLPDEEEDENKTS